MRDKYRMPVLEVNSITELLEHLMRAITQSKLEVRDLSAELKAFLNSGDVEHRITVQNLVEKFRKAYPAGGFSEASQVKLDAGIYAIEKFIGADTIADQIDRKTVTVFRDTLLKLPVNWQTRTKTVPAEGCRTLSPKTVKIYLSYTVLG